VSIKRDHTVSHVLKAMGVEDGKETVHARWRKIITEYSPLALSHPNDRIPALLGLAKQMQFITGGRYLAGLWEESFVRDLLWVAVANPGARTKGVALSWSWASQKAGVRYTNGQRKQIGGLGTYSPAELGNWGDVESELLGASCELVAAECAALGADDTGRVELGWVKLRGYAVDLEPLSESLFKEEDRWTVQVNGIKSRDVFWDAAPEGLEEGGELEKQRFCLLR